MNPQRSSATSRLAKYDDWYSAAHGWLMLEAQGRGIEAQNQKRLALVSSLRGLSHDVEPLCVTYDLTLTLDVLRHGCFTHHTAGQVVCPMDPIFFCR